jgi:hypothetical protein
VFKDNPFVRTEAVKDGRKGVWGRVIFMGKIFPYFGDSPFWDCFVSNENQPRVKLPLTDLFSYSNVYK